MHAINPEHPLINECTSTTLIDVVHELSRPIAVDKAYCKPCRRRCNITTRRVVSQIKFVRLPRYFIVRINRTCYDATSSTIYKNQRSVRTPMLLNIGNVMATPCSAHRKTMRLIACVRHVGPLATSGHYTADCFIRARWWRFDDAQVENCVPSFDDAVMLMYQTIAHTVV
jgi:ubiquitin C-terminal hydrolase